MKTERQQLYDRNYDYSKTYRQCRISLILSRRSCNVTLLFAFVSGKSIPRTISLRVPLYLNCSQQANLKEKVFSLHATAMEFIKSGSLKSSNYTFENYDFLSG